MNGIGSVNPNADDRRDKGVLLRTELDRRTGCRSGRDIEVGTDEPAAGGGRGMSDDEGSEGLLIPINFNAASNRCRSLLSSSSSA